MLLTSICRKSVPESSPRSHENIQQCRAWCFALIIGSCVHMRRLRHLLFDENIDSDLQDMGFGDRPANIRALQAVSGNVNAAVERLLSGL